MKRFLYARDGSVSVYLIVIIVPIFLFHAVLIDFIRVKLVERETEAAHQAAIRSVLSRFDRELQNYGLFGIAGSEEENRQLFQSVLDYNLTTSEDDSVFRYLDTRSEPDDIRLRPLFTLANHVVFRQQMLEDMKYKAPIEFTVELLDRFKKSGIAGQLQQSAKFYEHANEIEQKIRPWNDALEEAWETAQSYIALANRFYSKYNATLGELKELADRIGLNTADSVRQSIREVESSIERAEETLESLRSSAQSLSGTLAELQKNAEANAGAIQSLFESLRATNESISETNRQISEYVQTKYELEQLLKDILAYTALLLGSQSSFENDFAELDLLNEELQQKIEKARVLNEELRQEKEKLKNSLDNDAFQSYEVLDRIPVYSLEYFSVYKTDSGKILAKFSWLRSKWQATTLFIGEDYSEISGQLEQMRQQISSFESEQGAKERERHERMEQLETSDKEQKEKLGNALKELNSVIGNCGLWGEQDPFTSLYRKLEGESEENPGLYAKYYQYNSDLPAEPDEVYTPDQPGQTVKQVVSFSERISGLLTGIRDEIYMNEYALTRFNYRTAKLETGKNGVPPATHETSKPLDHPLADQEAEYILYGMNSCSGNYSAAYGEMFLFFLAIRTIEGLLEPKNAVLNIGSPLLVFMAAAAQGAFEAVRDMQKLVKGEAVPLLKKLKAVTVHYKDLLRLFMLLHSNDRKVMSRMQALIELNTGVDLTQRTTYMQTTASATVRVWFMPAAMRLMDGLGLLNCGNKDNRCQITKTAVMSY
ncbi:hypothetical protein [Paenibacillus sp. J2TS4]|uniref:hypothetical protein n=1 Tax=Paenibacillus sp. J2TS4 TaxID=2807194 RepID=UPI001B088C7E|nr:hypothetical protein [Paenibacillus sp. J2TS4]GIP32680.1 hypothetical protein J2TS4_18900 [Paenibacillus sp. J2TS4]